MADLPDVLDAMGKTPREFGTNVHFEGYHLVDGNRCVASVLAQAAFVSSRGRSTASTRTSSGGWAWRPQGARPFPQVKAATPAQAGAVRWCRTCGFEGPAAEYERSRSCPRCDEPWF